MFSDANLPEPNYITEIENPPKLVLISEKEDIFFCDKFTKEKRIRRYIYQMLIEAKKHLPENYFFKIYEAYRPLEAQKKLWDEVVQKQQKMYPDLSIQSEKFIALCDVFCANPYRQGSGHQSGAAIDVSLCDKNGIDYDMGGEVRGFYEESDFDYPVSFLARKNRNILKNALEKVGFINYPAEWWHYSFGDRLWAKLTGAKIAIFGKIDD
ncbi:MAG: D-alanyl-D-alanine carboxypeptidase family protein [Alphaproteobacteria bacterium]|nr:D-alanyl-D-alanine carboxypeptidase family protein [Alphaproteobacteria bacterium]